MQLLTKRYSVTSPVDLSSGGTVTIDSVTDSEQAGWHTVYFRTNNRTTTTPEVTTLFVNITSSGKVVCPADQPIAIAASNDVAFSFRVWLNEGENFSSVISNWTGTDDFVTYDAWVYREVQAVDPQLNGAISGTSGNSFFESSSTQNFIASGMRVAFVDPTDTNEYRGWTAQVLNDDVISATIGWNIDRTLPADIPAGTVVVPYRDASSSGAVRHIGSDEITSAEDLKATTVDVSVPSINAIADQVAVEDMTEHENVPNSLALRQKATYDATTNPYAQVSGVLSQVDGNDIMITAGLLMNGAPVLSGVTAPEVTVLDHQGLNGTITSPPVGHAMTYDQASGTVYYRWVNGVSAVPLGNGAVIQVNATIDGVQAATGTGVYPMTQRVS